MKKKVVILSGAGISAESGLGTFRDSGGLWEQYKVEDVATPEAFESNPELVINFYNLRRRQIANSIPNKAHLSLVDLEKHFDVEIITQNIDDLHERAGSKRVLHLHGEIVKAKCSQFQDDIFGIGEKDIEMGQLSKAGFQIRPHIVWFGEPVPNMIPAMELVQKADYLVIIGTSLNVYPAASLIHETNKQCEIFIIDPNEILISRLYKITQIKEVATIGLLKLQELLLK